VTGISNGGVTITATSKTDDSIKATIKVYVLLNITSSQVTATYTYDATTDTLTILSGGTWPNFSEPGILDGTLASLIIANSVGEGEVTVSNLTVTGDTTINGGGKNSVVFSSCILNRIQINKVKTNDEQPVRVQIDETTEVQNDINVLATGTAGAIITSNSPVMKVYAGSDVQLTGTSVVNELEITGSDVEAAVAVPVTTLTVATTGTNASITTSSPVENTIISAAATLSATANLNNVTVNAATTLTTSGQVNNITATANVVYGGTGSVTNLDINTAGVAATLNGNVTAVNVTVTGASVSGTGSVELIKTNNSLTVGIDTTLQNTSASDIHVTNSTSTNSVAVPTSNVVTINSSTTTSSEVASVKTGGTVSASNAVAGYDAIRLGLYDQAEQTAIKSRYASLLAALTGPSTDSALACKTYLIGTATATPYIKKFEVAGDGTNYTDYTAVAVSGNGNIVINYNLINAEAYAPTYKYTYVIADSDDADILDEEVAVAAANFKNTANDANMSVAVKTVGTINSYKVAINDATQGKANATLQAIVSNKIVYSAQTDADLAAIIAANNGKDIEIVKGTNTVKVSIDAAADEPTYHIDCEQDIKDIQALLKLDGTALNDLASTLKLDANISLATGISNSNGWTTGALTLDLNGKKLSGSYDGSTNLIEDMFALSSAKIIVDDSSSAKDGSIEYTMSAVVVGDAFWIKGTSSTHGGITLKNGSIIVNNAGNDKHALPVIAASTYCDTVIEGGKITFNSSGTGLDGYGISVYREGSNLTVTGGTISGGYGAVTGNGTAGNGGTTITISGGTLIGSDSNKGAAIYHPQSGTLTISGGTLTGYNGIYAKAGTINISGGTITGTGAKNNPTPFSNGFNNTGDAIILDSMCNYANDMTLTISGGTVQATNATNPGYAIHTVDNRGVLYRGTYASYVNYTSGQFVKKDDSYYRANGAIAANTTWAIGTSGATWRAATSAEVTVITSLPIIAISNTPTFVGNLVVADGTTVTNAWSLAFNINN